MYKWFSGIIFCLFITGFISPNVYSQQQDVTFHLTAHLLPGKNVLKVKRDFYDPYVWALVQNNVVYRINSQTLVVDDYTAKFAAYSNIPFIDIVGLSPDTAFIATNSTNVIEYANNSLRVIGSSDGIPGIVTSLGINMGWNADSYKTKGQVVISTNNGLRLFNTNTQQIGYMSDGKWSASSYIANSKIYESTYRTEMYKDSTVTDTSGWSTDTLKYQPEIINNTGGYYAGYIWEGNQTFGKSINTAIYITDQIYAYNSDFCTYFWGTERGMFRAPVSYSNNIATSYYYHYLDGIKVNKITNIYGLTGFSLSDNPLDKQTLLIGTDNGFYFSSSVIQEFGLGVLKVAIFHDDELGSTVIHDICVNATRTTPPICEDGVWLGAQDGLYLVKPEYSAYLNNQPSDLISFKNQPGNLSSLQICAGTPLTATINNTGYNNIEWYKDGVELPAANNDTLAITAAGDYNAVIYDPCADTYIESNHLKVTIITGPVFTFNYPDKIQSCNTGPDTLKTDYSPSYHYRWYTNGTLNGDTTSSLIVTLTGKYNVEVSACQGSWISSKEVTVNFIQLPAPVINAGKPAYCTGDNATFSIAVPVNTAYTINWYKDNVLLTANTNTSTLTTNIAGNYTVTITSNTVKTDGTTCSQTSPVQTLIFNPAITVAIQQTVNTTLCSGQAVTLQAIYHDGAVKWSTGENTDQINVTNTGVYKVTLTSASGCQADTSINITFLPNPILAISDTSVCTYKNQTVILTAPAGFSQYSWNGQTGSQTYRVSLPQTVTLIVTDANGCQASQQIHIIDLCPDIEIPNAFTPNSDQINDTWDIQGLDATAMVQVFNRYGILLYQSKGYAIPWNGQYKSKKLPPGVYYYIITAKSNKRKFSGPLTILY